MAGNCRSVPARVSLPQLGLDASKESEEEELRQDALCPFNTLETAHRLSETLGLPAPPIRPVQISPWPNSGLLVPCPHLCLFPFRLLPLRDFLLQLRFSVGLLCGEPGAGGVSGTGGGERRGRPRAAVGDAAPEDCGQCAGLPGSYLVLLDHTNSRKGIPVLPVRCRAARCESRKEGKKLGCSQPSQS